MSHEIPHKIPHKIPADFQKSLVSTQSALSAWKNITPIAKNEWVCWIISVKKSETRKNHIERALVELSKGKRRPCCWAGCIHRKN